LYGVLLVFVNKNTTLFTFNCVCLMLSFTQSTAAISTKGELRIAVPQNIKQ